jgi:aminomethyltransferase
LRLEMGYPLHGHEINSEISPLSAGLGWVVKLKRDVPFFGQKALVAESQTGPKKKLQALTIQDRRIARQGYKITDQNHKKIGEITSGTFSPHLNAPIALGFIDKEWKESTTPLFVEVRESLIPAHVVKLPFVKSGIKK